MMTESEVRDDGTEGPKLGPITREEDADEWLKMAKQFFKASVPDVVSPILPNTQKDVPPPPIPQLPKKDAHDVSKYKHKPKLSPEECLQKCAGAIEKYDAEECKAHREEIDTLMVFAGLFSAVVTAFSIESYQWLQSDPNDTIIVLLSQLAHPGGNQTQMAAVQTGLPNEVSVRIHAYWFLSLVLSHSAALVAILCKQWVREFERHSGLSDAEQFIAVRQMKLEGFESWRVAGIVAIIPLLLQSALGLFVLGLVDLLWHLHKTVAIVVLVPTTASLIFYASTTLLPGLQAIFSPFWLCVTLSQCPFKSPQAILALRILVLLPIRAEVIDSLCRFYWHSAELLHRVHASFRGQGKQVPRSLRRRRPIAWSDPWQRSVLPWPIRGPDFLTFAHTGSWLTVDQEFTSRRNAVYVSDASSRAVNDSFENASPPGFYFRGLVWLRDHVHQPGMRSWIFWSIWHTIPVIRRDIPHWRVEWSAFRCGVQAITPYVPFPPRNNMFRHPAGLILVYACYAEIEPSFISEALIHYFQELQFEAIDTIFHHLRTSLSNEADTMLSILYAIMAHAHAETVSSVQLRNIDLLLHATSQAVICHPGSLSRATLAYTVALFLRVVRIRGDFERWHSSGEDFVQLFRAVLNGGRGEPASLYTIREKATFAAFALTVDQLLARFATTSEEDSLSSSLFELLDILDGDDTNQDVYLGLLATALGSRTAAADHVNRYAEPDVMERARRRYDEQEGPTDASISERGLQSALSPAHHPDGSSEPVSEAELHLPASGTGASGGVDAAQRASDAITATRASAPSGQDTDDPGSLTRRILPQLPASLLGELRAVAQAAPDAELEPAGSPEDDYDGISLLASPTGLAPGISGTEGDAEFAQALSLALGEYVATSSPRTSRDHAAADAETTSGGSQTGLDLETLFAAALAPSGAAQQTAISASNIDATRPLESRTGQEFMLPSAVTVAPPSVDSGTTVSGTATGTHSTSSLAGHEPDSRAAAADDLGEDDPGVSRPDAHDGHEISALDVHDGGGHGSPGVAPGVPEQGMTTFATDSEAGRPVSAAGSAAAAEPGPTRRASTALGEYETAPHVGRDDGRASATALETAVSTLDDEVSTEHQAAPSGPETDAPSSA